MPGSPKRIADCLWDLWEKRHNSNGIVQFEKLPIKVTLGNFGTTLGLTFVKIPLLGKIGPKNQNCQFKLKFGT